MSRGLFHRRSRPFAAIKPRHRRGPSRARAVAWDLLEPRTLLSTWYVNSSNTNSSPTGSQTNPYETIQAAINTAASGDKILVETGNGYVETDTVNVPDLTIEADTGQSPVLGSENGNDTAGFTVSAGGVTISGFTVQGFGASGVVVTTSGGLTLSDDTIQDNSSGTPSAVGSGGGINNAGVLTLTNTTIDHNWAGFGGGIFDAGSLTAVNCTIADNTIYSGNNPPGVASSDLDRGGGLYLDPSPVTFAQIYNTIIASNDDGSYLYPNGPADDVAGEAESGEYAYNLIGADATGIGNQDGVENPGLEPSASSNGGPTDTIALSPESPAIGAGSSSIPEVTVPSTDQRGLPRTSGSIDVGAFQLQPDESYPTVYMVDTTVDDNSAGAGTDDLTTGALRYVVNQADKDPNPSGSLIEFDQTVFDQPQTITLSASLGPLDLFESAGPEVFQPPPLGGNFFEPTISGGNDVGVFQVGQGVKAAINFLKISDGFAVNGGGVSNAGTLTIYGGSIVDCSATADGGGIYNTGALSLTTTIQDNSAGTPNNPNNPDGAGGGIYNSGTLVVELSGITGNQAVLSGGGIDNEGSLSIGTSTISDNQATTADPTNDLYAEAAGGGIYTDGPTSVSDCTIESNSAVSDFGGSGGGIDADDSISDSSIIVGSSTITNNKAGSGGGIAGDSISVYNSTITDNTAYNTGGGLYGDTFSSNITVDSSTFSGDSAEYGGGLAGDGLSVDSSTFAGNSAAYGGGGIDSEDIVVDSSTFSGDSAEYGGGIEADELTLVNSTIAGNSALVRGGGLDLGGGARNTIVNSTIAENNVSSSGVGGGLSTSVAVTLNNTIVALNTAGTGSGAPASDISVLSGYGYQGSVAGSNNLIGTGGSGGLSNGNRNQLDVSDPGLDPNGLEDNGGPNQTIALETGSPAINAGSNDLVLDASGNPLLDDEAGNPRFEGGIVDVGAFQAQVPPAPAAKVYVNVAYAGDAMWTPVILSDGSVHVIGYDAFSAIQPAVNAVAAGGIVNIAGGTYDGNVTITGNVVLVGSGASSTIISGPGTGAAIDVNGGTLNASGITVTGFSHGFVVEGFGVLSINDSTIEGNIIGVQIDDGNGSVDGVNFDGANQTDLVIGSDAGPVTVGATRPDDFAATGTYIDNASSQTINATDDTFDGVNPAVAGVSQLFAIQAKISDELNNPNAGPVEIVKGQIFVTPAAEASAPGAIERAESDAMPGDTINIAPGTYGGPIDVTQDLTFAGAGASVTTISDGGSVFSIASSVETTISGLTVTGGTAASGGGIDNAGMLTLSADTISGNMATGSGGGIENEATGTLIISDSTISGNTAGGNGGGIDNAGMLTLTNTTIARNSAASGGGISDEGTLTAAVNVTIADGNNSVGSGSGGGLDVTGAGAATLYNTIVAQNTDSGGRRRHRRQRHHLGQLEQPGRCRRERHRARLELARRRQPVSRISGLQRWPDRDHWPRGRQPRDRRGQQYLGGQFRRDHGPARRPARRPAGCAQCRAIRRYRRV